MGARGLCGYILATVDKIKTGCIAATRCALPEKSFFRPAPANDTRLSNSSVIDRDRNRGGRRARSKCGTEQLEASHGRKIGKGRAKRKQPW